MHYDFLTFRSVNNTLNGTSNAFLGFQYSRVHSTTGLHLLNKASEPTINSMPSATEMLQYFWYFTIEYPI